MKQENKAQYYIQQVADMTGLSKQVIRKWEERYRLVKPARLSNGYRVYSESDINQLLAAKSYSDQGLSLKEATSRVKENSQKAIEKSMPEYVNTPHELNQYVFLLLENGAKCDELEINMILQQAYHQLGLESFLNTVIMPFLNIVGNRWENGEWDEYQEAVSSLVIRDFLVQIRRNYRYRENAKLVLGACMPFEQHEIPLIILLLQFMIKGWKTTLIGSSPAPGSINALVERLNPDLVLLSATTTIPFEKDPVFLEDINKFASKHKNIDFYFGGPGSIEYMKNKKELSSIKLVHSLDIILK